ncbi:uncharacterized protein LOC118721433 isoform X4 [Pipistrellus kuhlii]|uniref:uncharacterized protein LOC118721433 isoform X4 n=1 Tax=Pipistrellus kuhlii TaxID=59472 RepID=UPI001E272171|nr:uncharacterized protein LOC118721433 isoform X4 [Pipistrellus kuhlii]
MLGDQQEKERGKRKFLNGETDATSSELHPPVRWRLGARETLSSSGGDRAVRPPRSLVLGVREACFWCHRRFGWMDAPSPSPPSVIHHPLVHRSRLQHHGQLPGRCGPGASPGGWTRGRRDHTKDFLLDQECESSCEWNWEERMGEKEGGRDEAWQCQKRWEPHGRRNRVGESLSMGSSCRHPPGGPWATYKVLEESELGVSGRRSASSCGTGSVTDTPSSCSLSPNPDQALTGSQLVQAK